MKSILIILIAFIVCGCTNEQIEVSKIEPNTTFRYECEENGGFYTEFNNSHYENACTYATKDQIIEMLNNRV